MGDLTSRDVDYTHDGTLMRGYLAAPTGSDNAPTILLIHDAFGLNDDLIRIAHELGALGFAVFAADVWGGRTCPATQDDIGPLIGGMVGDRDRWLARVAAAHAAAAAQPEIDAASLVLLGYCFGGSSALEHLRSGADVRGVVAIHPGLDILGDGWSLASSSAQVLVCTGADDPMATAQMRSELTSSMDGAGIDWQLDLFSGTKHAFTNPKSQFAPMPDVVAYHPRNAARAWDATIRFLRELLPDARPI